MIVSIQARGHPNIRLTHDKSLEVTCEGEISARATCVVGVGAVFDLSKLRRLHGRVQASLSAGPDSFTINGDVNPDFCSRHRVVFRRSDVCDSHTLLINCDRLAADVPPEMARRLQQGAPLRIDMETAFPQEEEVQRQAAPYSGGILYLAGSPIGNYGDASPRSLEVLQQADLVAAEDTRKLARLLRHFGLRAAKLAAYHEHSRPSVRQRLLGELQSGKSVALVSDAGVPAVSDPGYRLAAEALDLGIPVVPVPGPSACISALTSSGLPTDSFTFAGFLPRAAGKCRARLQELADRTETQVFYEAPHRILKTLQQLVDILGDRRACLAREMTKDHEEYLRGRLSGILETLRRRPAILGEITLVVEGSGAPKADRRAVDREISRRLAAGESPRTVRDALSQEFGLPKRELYKRILDRKDSGCT